MINPLADPYLILTKVYKEDKYLKQAIAETPVEPLNKARTVKICYGVLEKDIYLDETISFNASKTPRLSVRLILKIALYMLEFMGKKDYMVVDYAVDLSKKAGKEGASGFVNAFLRSYRVPPVPKGADERISLFCSVPLWLAKKIRRSYKGEAEKILSAPSLGICVRFERNAEKYLSAEHIDTPFENTYIFPNFVRDEGFFAGDYTFQSVGSAAICAAVEGVPELLDACAAPGGKSVLLAAKCGHVTSTELHAHRVRLIEEYCRRMNADNVDALEADSSVYDGRFAERFDAVLVDAPCSGTGVLNENPDIKLRRKESDVAELAKIQFSILSNCAKYVKKGGALYYSTCSLLPEENDSVVHAFSESTADFAVKELSSPLGHIKTKYGMQFLPHISLGAGFYVAAFVKQ